MAKSHCTLTFCRFFLLANENSGCPRLTDLYNFHKFIDKCYDVGIDIASGTNGIKLQDDKLPEIVEKLTYLRININAAEPEAYAQIMGTSTKNYYKVLEIIK